MSSRSESCCVRVMESAISDVSRVLIEPSSARVIAGCTARPSRSSENGGSPIAGKPCGTSPMMGAPLDQTTLRSVPAISAASVAGRYLRRRPGQKMLTARVTAPMTIAWWWMSPRRSGQARIAPSGPPSTTPAPPNGSVWETMMITPTPDMNPEITE